MVDGFEFIKNRRQIWLHMEARSAVKGLANAAARNEVATANVVVVAVVALQEWIAKDNVKSHPWEDARAMADADETTKARVKVEEGAQAPVVRVRVRAVQVRMVEVDPRGVAKAKVAGVAAAALQQWILKSKEKLLRWEVVRVMAEEAVTTKSMIIKVRAKVEDAIAAIRMMMTTTMSRIVEVGEEAVGKALHRWVPRNSEK